jgi:hypothetical protein
MAKVTRSAGVAVVAVAGLALMASVAQAKHVLSGPLQFQATGGTSYLVIEAAGAKPRLVCDGGTRGAGQVKPALSLKLEFLGCGAAAKDCGNGRLGVVATRALPGSLGYIKAPGEVGVELSPAEAAVLFSFLCPGPEGGSEGSIRAAVTGSVIGRITPANEMSTTFSVQFSELGGNSEHYGGKQEIERFEGAASATLGAELSLDGSPPESGVAREIVTLGLQDSPQTFGKVHAPDPTMIKTGGAEPQWGRCRKAQHASYDDPNCQMRAAEKNGKRKGKYEFFPIPS